MDIFHTTPNYEDSSAVIHELQDALEQLMLKSPETVVPEKTAKLLTHIASTIVQNFASYSTDNISPVTLLREISEVLDGLVVVSQLSGMQDIFIRTLTPVIFETITDPCISGWCGREILRMFNVVLKNSDEKMRHELIEKQNLIHLCKLVDLLSVCGDYDFQTSIVECVFLICSRKQIEEYSKDLIPEDVQLNNSFLAINHETFYADVRAFLNIINEKSQFVYSVVCTDVLLDSISLPGPMEFDMRGLWVDFNLKLKSISWYVDGSFSTTDTQELFVLPAESIKNIITEVMDEAIKISLELQGEIITELSRLQHPKEIVLLMEKTAKTRHISTKILKQYFINTSLSSGSQDDSESRSKRSSKCASLKLRNQNHPTFPTNLIEITSDEEENEQLSQIKQYLATKDSLQFINLDSSGDVETEVLDSMQLDSFHKRKRSLYEPLENSSSSDDFNDSNKKLSGLRYQLVESIYKRPTEDVDGVRLKENKILQEEITHELRRSHAATVSVATSVNTSPISHRVKSLRSVIFDDVKEPETEYYTAPLEHSPQSLQNDAHPRTSRAVSDIESSIEVTPATSENRTVIKMKMRTKARKRRPRVAVKKQHWKIRLHEAQKVKNISSSCSSSSEDLGDYPKNLVASINTATQKEVVNEMVQDKYEIPPKSLYIGKKPAEIVNRTEETSKAEKFVCPENDIVSYVKSRQNDSETPDGLDNAENVTTSTQALAPETIRVGTQQQKNHDMCELSDSNEILAQQQDAQVPGHDRSKSDDIVQESDTSVQENPYAANHDMSKQSEVELQRNSSKPVAQQQEDGQLTNHDMLKPEESGWNEVKIKEEQALSQTSTVEFLYPSQTNAQHGIDINAEENELQGVVKLPEMTISHSKSKEETAKETKLTQDPDEMNDDLKNSIITEILYGRRKTFVRINRVLPTKQKKTTKLKANSSEKPLNGRPESDNTENSPVVVVRKQMKRKRKHLPIIEDDTPTNQSEEGNEKIAVSSPVVTVTERKRKNKYVPVIQDDTSSTTDEETNRREGPNENVALNAEILKINAADAILPPIIAMARDNIKTYKRIKQFTESIAHQSSVIEEPTIANIDNSDLREVLVKENTETNKRNIVAVEDQEDIIPVGEAAIAPVSVKTTKPSRSKEEMETKKRKIIAVEDQEDVIDLGIVTSTPVSVKTTKPSCPKEEMETKKRKIIAVEDQEDIFAVGKVTSTPVSVKTRKPFRPKEKTETNKRKMIAVKDQDGTIAMGEVASTSIPVKTTKASHSKEETEINKRKIIAVEERENIIALEEAASTPVPGKTTKPSRLKEETKTNKRKIIALEDEEDIFAVGEFCGTPMPVKTTEHSPSKGIMAMQEIDATELFEEADVLRDTFNKSEFNATKTTTASSKLRKLFDPNDLTYMEGLFDIAEQEKEPKITPKLNNTNKESKTKAKTTLMKPHKRKQEKHGYSRLGIKKNLKRERQVNQSQSDTFNSLSREFHQSKLIKTRNMALLDLNAQFELMKRCFEEINKNAEEEKKLRSTFKQKRTKYHKLDYRGTLKSEPKTKAHKVDLHLDEYPLNEPIIDGSIGSQNPLEIPSKSFPEEKKITVLSNVVLQKEKEVVPHELQTVSEGINETSHASKISPEKAPNDTDPSFEDLCVTVSCEGSNGSDVTPSKLLTSTTKRKFIREWIETGGDPLEVGRILRRAYSTICGLVRDTLDQIRGPVPTDVSEEYRVLEQVEGICDSLKI